jgi:hypothetical protein
LVLGLNLISPDAWIAGRNLQLATATGDVAACDGQYLTELSADAFPVLAAALPKLPEEIRQPIRDRLMTWQSSRSEDWRSWSLARHWAARGLAEAGIGVATDR